LIHDIQYIVKKKVELSTKNLLDDLDITIRSHARSRRQALKKWMTENANPLAWDSDAAASGNFALLSLILCVDPNAENPTLILSKSHVTYEGLVLLLITYATAPNQKRPAPMTKDGGFQYLLPIAYEMVAKLIPPGNDVKSGFSSLFIDMMKSMRIHLLPWHKNSPNAYATDLDIWVSLRPKKGHISSAPLTIQDRIQMAADKVAREDPQAPWDLPERLSDMNQFWTKQCLPACWSLSLASLSNKQSQGYVGETYRFVSQQFDGENWKHHLALVIAICFSRVVPDICFINETDVSSSDPLRATSEIRNMEWVPAQSTSRRGTVVPFPFIVMMSTALIGFWDSRSPLAKHLVSNNNVLGKPWTDKHGTDNFRIFII
jgi:hypothetical protein